MKYFLVVLNLLFVLGSLSAQNFIKKIHPFSASFVSKVSAQSDTLKILAVLVEFQTDRDGTTFGNGKFGTVYSQNYGQNILDPLPHDKRYFESHLLFAKNYFEKVSNGKLVIQYTVLSGILTVSKTMRNYSPSRNSDDYTLLADFAKEVWKIADSANSGFDFSQYNVFTIFHAGAGRDVVLPGTLGNEHNIPSLYLGEKSFKNIYGNSFDGFPVKNNFKITNTIIMPETENREVSNGLTTSFFQLSINGLMVANIGSAIGLPDLYNTSTGESAIGRFGLMDGQSFFAFRGLFPPEPSPWAKIYMGWANAVTVDPGIYSNVKVFAKLAAAVSDTVILKIPINSKEYFLVENRNRDVHKDGVTLTYLSNDNTLTKTFTADVADFNNYDVSALKGVVTDVNEFDWAVPGNGIVIWHIDENIINDNYASNTINAGTNRGIFVEEADGIQDIGQQFTDIFGDQIVGEGAPEDFWFKSNSSEFFTNKFSRDTRPNTNSNSGANSLITFSDFSDTANAMTFNIAYGDSIIKSVLLKKINNQFSIRNLSILQQGQNFKLGVVSNSKLYIFDRTGKEIITFDKFATEKPATHNNSFFVVDSSKVIEYILADSTLQETSSVTLPASITTPPVISYSSSNYDTIMVGTRSGKIYFCAEQPVIPFSTSLGIVYSVNVSSNPINEIATNGNYYAVASGSEFFDSNGKNITFSETINKLALTKNSNGDNISIVETNNEISTIKDGVVINKFDITGDTASFILADLKNDGQNYIIYTDGDQVVAKNIDGALADNFSFTDPLGLGFSGTPLAADFEGDSMSEIIAATVDGRIYAIDGSTGKIVKGFPLTVGESLSSTPAIFVDNGKLSLAVTTKSNLLYAWNIGITEGKLFWSSENGNNLNTAFVGAPSQSNFVNKFFPLNRAYNYPNPVYGNSTNIRYYVSEDSKIDIKIFDIAGSFVDELNDFATGGLDHETVWNVGNIQSGIYLARIQVTSNSGKAESKIIKIAVVK